MVYEIILEYDVEDGWFMNVSDFYHHLKTKDEVDLHCHSLPCGILVCDLHKSNGPMTFWRFLKKKNV
jgi:hypothetical protein